MAATDVVLQQHAAALRVMSKRHAALQATMAQVASDLAEIKRRPRSIAEQIDAIPGRRIESVFSGEVEFDLNNLGAAGLPVIIQISQDGDFIMTHYPMALWFPSEPNPGATNLGRWRPVSSYPLPVQQVTTDIIDIKYNLDDGGSQRFFQNNPRGPLLSRPDNVIPCAIPTQWSPNAAIKFTPIYQAITWNSEVPPTKGILHVDLIGYRIVNL